MDIVYFSPTGNTAHLAQHLARTLQSRQIPANLHPLEWTEPGDLDPDGHLVLMYAVHAFNPPRTVIHFVRKLIPDEARTVSILSVGGAETWMNAGASLSVRRILQKKGFLIQQDELLAMPPTILIGLPDHQAQEMISKAEDQILHVASRIQSGQRTAIDVPLKSRIVTFLGRLEGLGARLYGLELRASDACTACRLCVEECPERNIRMDNAARPAFGLRCLMCMRCIYNCPEYAIAPRFSKFIPLKDGYQIDRLLHDE